jgi:hypothetical protein
MSLTLYNAADDIQQVPLQSAHTSGSGSIVLSISGATLPAVPFVCTVITAATYGTGTSELLATYTCSAVALNTPSAGQCTLTVTAITADRAFAAGDYLDLRPSASLVSAINTAITAINTGLNGPPTGLVKGSGGTLLAATAGTDYVVPSGSITGTAGGLSSTLAVGSGGTGATSLAAYSVLVGNGTGIVGTVAVGTAGRVLVDQGGSANPAFEVVSGDATLTAAGALTVASIGGKAVTLGGSLTTSGAFGLTLTLKATTNVTLPTSGNLAIIGVDPVSLSFFGAP